METNAETAIAAAAIAPKILDFFIIHLLLIIRIHNVINYNYI